MDISTLGTLGTEARNPATADLDAMSVTDLLTVMNDGGPRTSPPRWPA